MIVCVPVRTDGSIDPRWGRAERLAVAQVGEDGIADWEEFAVGWDVLHDSGEGSHHARVVRFLREHRVEAVVADHMGGGMLNTLGKMGIALHLGAEGDAREAVVSALGS